MSQTIKNVQLILLGGFLASALLAVGVMLGMGLASDRRSDIDLMKLHASASSTGKTVSLATGLSTTATKHSTFLTISTAIFNVG